MMKGKIMKKTLAYMLVIAIASSMSFGFGAMAALAADTDTTCTHVYENGFCEQTESETHYEAAILNDNGTEEDPADDYYEIGNAGQLYWFAELVNTEVIDGDTPTYPNSSANAKLIADIVVNKEVIVGNANEINLDDEDEIAAKGFRPWTPIAENTAYKGVFDGDGHFISGLYIYKEDSNEGLFSTISGGTVKNVGVKDSFLRIRSNENSYLGAISGRVFKEATIENCFSVNNYIRSGFQFVGGIVGYCDVSTSEGVLITIKNCYNTSKVMAYQYFGGIAGHTNNAVIIEKCYNLGTIAPHDKTVGKAGEENKLYYGGLVGRMQINSSYFQNPMLLNCYNLGDIELPDNQLENNIGGLVGIIVNSTNLQVVIENCYNGSDFLTTDGGGLPTEVADRCIYSDIGYIQEIDDVSISNVFYPEGITSNFEIRNENPAATTAVTAEQFANGWLAYMLQAGQTAEEEGGEIPEVWGQTLSGDNADAFPVLGGAKVNYGFTCDVNVTEAIYTNSSVSQEGEDRPAHTHGTTWETDANEHWNECVCGDKANKAAHADSDNNGKCDTCDYTMSVGAEQPVTTTDPETPVDNPSTDGLGTGAIIGIVVASVAVLGGGGYAVYWFVIRKKRTI